MGLTTASKQSSLKINLKDREEKTMQIRRKLSETQQFIWEMDGGRKETERKGKGTGKGKEEKEKGRKGQGQENRKKSRTESEQ